MMVCLYQEATKITKKRLADAEMGIRSELQLNFTFLVGGEKRVFGLED